ncbi:cyclic GMP-AMP synthase [Triplophysa rosa]|uniref:Cyclic GMP-AMP synthase n=1 Tax=Triplophysa rosa TaxID=992332 RepID=A0A9W8C0T6_TRIRA|nr:cyclic GMP-AMP synthase [Triplophysa rosa]KAI7805301.1 putative cyclic GMP-AMP synthase [Triplophysa rosa]
MSSPRGPSGARAMGPVQPFSKPQTKGDGKSQEQRGPYNSDRNSKPTESPADTRNGRAPTRRSGSEKQTESQDSHATSTSDRKAAPLRQANGNPQSKKQKDCERDEPLQTFESKTEDQLTTEEKNRRARKSTVAHAPGNDAQKSAKSDIHSKPKIESRHQSSTIVSDINPTSRQANSNRQSRKQKDISDTDSVREDASPELSNSTSQDKRRPKLTKTQKSHNRESTEEDTRAHQSTIKKELEKVLHATIDKLKIKKFERSKASRCVNEVTDEVISHLKQNMTWCRDIESLTTGSYYENVKICEPDEFDVMLTIPVERVDTQEFNDNGAFYSIALKRHPNKHPLDRFLNEDKTIRASEMLNEFRHGVKEAVESLKSIYNIVVQRKKQKCPAVTLEVTEKGNAISIDFVLGLKVHGNWPINTKDGFKIEKWLGTKEKSDLKRNPYYLVPKYEGKGNVEHGGVVAKDAWRISFSHIEKDILKRHGHSKTCCEAKGKKCCRKECLKLLKYLLSQLKKEHSDKMSKFCSYHAKTTLLHACATKVEDSEWAYDQLANCFQQLLDDFVRYLKNQDLRNFFVPSQNLLHQNYLPKSNCEFLANQIEIQRNNNFRIFQ